MRYFLLHLRNLIVAILLLAAFATIGGLIYLNQIGFPGKYGTWVRDGLATRGIEVQFQSLRFSPRYGLIATGAEFYQNPDDQTPTLTADYISIDIDKSLALRGLFELREIVVSGGTTTLPVDEDGTSITATHLHGEIHLQPDNRIRIRNGECLIAGLKIDLEADLKLPDPDQDNQEKPPDHQAIARIILKELTRWKIPPDAPPSITFSLRGDLDKPSRIITEFNVTANELSRNDYSLGTLELHGDVQDQLITIDHLLLADDTGQAEGQADWNLTNKKGRFKVTSGLQLQNFLKTCFDVDILPRLKIKDAPYIQAQGTLLQREDKSISVKTSGFANIDQFTFLDRDYQNLKSKFSWQDGDLFLQDLEAIHKKGQQLNGDLLLKDELVRFQLRSNLPLQAFSPFIKKDSATDNIVSRFKLSPKSVLAVEIDGEMPRNDLQAGTARGKIHATGLKYRDIAIHQLFADFDITPHKIEFSRVNTVLNDDNETERRRYNGPTSDPIHVDFIHIDRQTKISTVSNMRGTFWPTPIVRAFAPKVAAHLQKNYRFHHPPTLTLNGAFSGKKDRPQDTQFSILVRTTGQTHYPFLGRNLPLTQLSADVTMRGHRIDIDRLQFATLQGAAAGKVQVLVHPDQKAIYQGQLQWHKISFPALSQVYQFDEVNKGTLWGKINFTGQGDKVRNLNSTGTLGLQKGNLASLPVLGPLSPIIAGILGDKRMGYERAKDASATFQIKSGVWQSTDIVATSQSITLTGNGWVDLDTQKMDMTIRMNAKGLLGLITLPLKPFRGLFQFRGTGQFTDSKWSVSPFTKPSVGKQDPIFQLPGR